MVAGDGDRAAFAFLGTTAAGDATGDDPTFPAVWHLYVAHTYDGGASWATADVTPNDPVQRGDDLHRRHDLRHHPQPARLHGRRGRRRRAACWWATRTAAWAPASRGGANTFAAEARIARQTGGQRLYAAFDP